MKELLKCLNKECVEFKKALLQYFRHPLGKVGLLSFPMEGRTVKLRYL